MSKTPSKLAIGDLVLLVALTIFLAAITTAMRGMRIVDLAQPVLVVVGLSVLAWLWPAFRYCNFMLAILVAFSTAFSLLVYVLGAGHFPLADPELAAIDSAFGINAHRIAEETAARPWLSKAMFLIYFSVIPQTMLLIVWLGLRNDERLSVFLRRFMICGLVTAAFFAVFPALGSAGAQPASWNLDPYRDLMALRNGELTTISWQTAQGIITFPSFHTIWAILLMLALPTRPMIVLNVLMVISTVTTGGHYAVDVVAGVLVAMLMIPVADRYAALYRSYLAWKIPVKTLTDG